jgi:hypothetical protein
MNNLPKDVDFLWVPDAISFRQIGPIVVMSQLSPPVLATGSTIDQVIVVLQNLGLVKQS